MLDYSKMNPVAKEEYFGSIHFVSPSQSKLDYKADPLWQQFTLRENPEYHLPSLERVRVESGFTLYLTGTWSDNIAKGVGYDPASEAIALTSGGARQGCLEEFAKEHYILEARIINLQPIPDVDKITVELSFGRRQAAVHAVGSLPNLGMSQEEPAQGLISVGTLVETKAEARGASVIKPYIPRIPGAVNKWEYPKGSNSFFLMGPADPSVLSRIRAGFRIIYKLPRAESPGFSASDYK